MNRIKGTKDQLCAEAISIENEVETLIELKAQTTCSKVKKEAIDGRLKFIRPRLSAIKSELKKRKAISFDNSDSTPHFDRSGLLSTNVFKLNASSPF